MTNRKSKKSTPRRQEEANLPEGQSDEVQAFEVGHASLGGVGSQLAWSRTTRCMASIFIVGYLAVVLLGPLSNPVSSPYFSQPLARTVAPVHQALFQGHGYRFFGPDPGPSHRVLYRGTRSDGTEFEGAFPDREGHWPRLQYHRWFMLSETLFHESSLVPSETQLNEYKLEYDKQIERLSEAGQADLVEQLKRERAVELSAIEANTQRVRGLAAAIANVVSNRNDGVSVEIFLQERSIPFPEEVSQGIRISDRSFLNEPVRIGTLNRDGFQLSSQEMILPTEPSAVLDEEGGE